MNFVDETYDDLSALVTRDFGDLPEGILTNGTVLDWMHYRARLIPRRPRRVQLSSEVNLARTIYPAIDQIRSAFERGADISPWLSERVRKQRSNPKADLMFNQWQISHFHLGSLFDRPNRIGPRPRGRPLLFAHVSADRTTFLDVQPHGSWTMQGILKILHDVSPTDLPELEGIHPPRDGSLTDEHLSNLRRNGYNGPIVIDGKAFVAPGMGQTASHHAARLYAHSMYFLRLLEGLRTALTENRMERRIQMQLAGSIGIPIRLGLRLDAGCLVVYEKMRGIEFATLRAFE